MFKWLFLMIYLRFRHTSQNSPRRLADCLPVVFIEEGDSPNRLSGSLSNQSGVKSQQEVIRSVQD